MKALRLAVSRALIRSVGRSSQGIRLCLEEGLTAGKTVDYVYRNRPSGTGLLGRWIDARFLADPGWEAVRSRRRHLEELLCEAIASLRGRGRSIALLDIASGPAAYVLSVLQRMGERDLSARCRDLDTRWLDEGAAEANHLGLRNVRFEKGDAFDRKALLALVPQPNIVASSGFYDWITDDEKVRGSIRDIHDVLESGGYFVLTNQTAHPDLEFVSAVFEDFNHAPLRMKMRPAEQVNGWLAEAGFTVERTLSDALGYYSVTKARKP